jgi:phosphomevalonate kinase
VAAAVPIRLPADIGLVAVWTGTAADTSEILARLSHRMADGGAGIRAALDRLGEVAEAAIGAARSRDGQSLLARVEEFGAGMEDLGQAAGIDIVSARHRELSRLADRFGVSYKPSGAGVGDMGIGLSCDADSLIRFGRAAEDLGLFVISVAPAAVGLA